MKSTLLTVMVMALVFQAKAELFSPRSLAGGAIGAAAGAIIGHNNGRHAGEGAAIGAGVGLLAGALSDRHRGHGSHYSGGYGGYYSGGHGHLSLGYSSGYRSHHGHGYWGPSYSYGYRPAYYPRSYYAPVISTPYTQPVIIQQLAPAPASPAPQQVTIINNNYYSGSSTPMSSANAMFGR